ncbi:MAG: plasmid stabilization protein [Methylobacterium frigidaeris]
MPAVTIRNLSEEAHRALNLRAVRHGCSTEAEIRNILEAVARPVNRLRLGTALSASSRDAGLTDADVDDLTRIHDRKAADPMTFE